MMNPKVKKVLIIIGYTVALTIPLWLYMGPIFLMLGVLPINIFVIPLSFIFSLIIVAKLINREKYSIVEWVIRIAWVPLLIFTVVAMVGYYASH